jgi:hypothetical protein
MAGTNLYGETDAEVAQFSASIRNAIVGMREDAANHRAIMDAHAEAQTAYGYFNELMERYNQLRESYVKISAEQEEAVNIIREIRQHQPDLHISKDEVNARLDSAANRAFEEFQAQRAASKAAG